MFITLEGIEGAGKSTVQYALAKHFQDLGREVICTREPGGSKLGKSLRSLLLDARTQICSQAELFLFLADRAEHMEETIKPSLAQGKVVICDRFIHSTIAYQGGGRGIDMLALTHLNTMAIQNIMPKKVLLLDIDVQQGLTRARKRNYMHNSQVSEGRFEAEDLAFHERIRQSYLEQAKEDSERFCIIDASQSAEEVINHCIKILKD